MNWKKLREDHKLSQEYLASILGVTVEELQRWEDDGPPPPEIEKHLYDIFFGAKSIASQWNWKALRETSNITLENAANFLGVTTENVQRWENGEEPPEIFAKEMLKLYTQSNHVSHSSTDLKTSARSFGRKPITCSMCGSRDIAYVAEYHRSIFLRFFSLVFLAIAIWLSANAIITLLGNPEADVSMSLGCGGICFIIFICFQIAIFFSEARTHVKCVCKDCGNVWLHD